MRLPAAFFNTLDNSVVLPLPRKPVTTVAGIFFSSMSVPLKGNG